MATIVTRSGKGSPLTHAEVDSNFTNLNTDKLELSGGTMTGNLSFGDNDKAIFGAGSDLQIYHDGSNSIISDQGTGHIKIYANDFRVTNAANTEQMITANQDGAVTLYYDSVDKLATTSTGVDITGTLTSDGLILDNNGTIQFNDPQATDTILIGSNDNDLVIRTDDGVIQLKTNENKVGFQLANNGDISFYEDTGTTAKFFWDASAESLGIGTTSPLSRLTVQADASANGINIVGRSGGQEEGWLFWYKNNASTLNAGILGDNQALKFATGSANTERMRIDSSGNVGIGTSSPSDYYATDLVIDVPSEGGMTIVGGTTAENYVMFADGTADLDQYRGYIGYSHASNYLRFGSNGTEAFRLDASGNLLVGTTDTNPTGNNVVGTKLNGQARFSVSGGPAAEFNRKTSDGEILRFRKDGATVGSIGSVNTDQLYIACNDTTDAGLRFDGDNQRITPCDASGGTLNNQIDLGGNGLAFKDLYLSGAANVGGQVVSSSSFKLDTNVSTPTGNTIFRPASNTLAFGTNSSEAMRIDSSGNVGIGVTPSAWDTLPAIQVSTYGGLSAGGGYTRLSSNAYLSTYPNTWSYINTNTASLYEQAGGQHIWSNAASGTAGNSISFDEAMRIDSSGNLLVGQTTASDSAAGIYAAGSGRTSITRDGGFAIRANRLTSDGEIIRFAKDGTTVGSIGSISGSYLYIGDAGAVGMGFIDTAVRPVTDGANADNVYDLGVATVRWDDIYATNGTIQTSDQNEKQDIAELSDAEQRVAVAAKGLLRKFRWKDAVAEKGDEARTHFGIIAQDLQAAFAAEGLDAGDYAMFIHTTWTDEETGEERSRMGVRYSELLAFIIAAI